MNLQYETKYSPIEVQGLPRVDRFFPDCGLGLVELYACRVYGLRDVKKIWFGNTFKYDRRVARGWLNESRSELAGSLGLDGDVIGKAFEALYKYYGIRARAVTFTDFGAILDEVHATLTRGLPVLSTFDMSFLRSDSRASGPVQLHMIGICAIDAAAGTLRALDQLRGEVTIPLSQYEQSLERFSNENLDFFLLRCERDREGESLPLVRADVLRDMRVVLGNLRSTDPLLGLNALRLLAQDIGEAIESEQQAFAIPGQWIVTHDRYTLRRALQYWKEANVATSAQLDRLDRLLGEAFMLWFQMHMTIERALHDGDTNRMREAVALLHKVTPIEEGIANLWADVLREAGEGDDVGN